MHTILAFERLSEARVCIIHVQNFFKTNLPTTLPLCKQVKTVLLVWLDSSDTEKTRHNATAHAGLAVVFLETTLS